MEALDEIAVRKQEKVAQMRKEQEQMLLKESEQRITRIMEKIKTCVQNWLADTKSDTLRYEVGWFDHANESHEAAKRVCASYRGQKHALICEFYGEPGCCDHWYYIVFKFT